jgi:hypothetical protein
MKIFALSRYAVLCGAFALLAMCNITFAQPTAEPHTYAPGSPTYYRQMHGEKERVSVFRRDPNIWVYTPEVAKRAGMPLEWASDELKGVAAAAFRMERDGAEEDCGWGGNRDACRPVTQCVLELYFDRQAHPLPWDKNALLVDVFSFINGSNTHIPIGPTLSDEPRTRLGLIRQPFSSLETGEELSFSGLRVTAYDREIHGRYAFVRLSLGCSRGTKVQPFVLRLETNDSKGLPTDKVFHEVYLPASWYARVVDKAAQEQKNSEDFYQQVWKTINQGDKK